MPVIADVQKLVAEQPAPDTSHGVSMSMRTSYEAQRAEQIEIVRQIASGADRIVGRRKWVGFARHVWPFKTAHKLAEIGGASVRTAERWMNGELDPPYPVYLALFAEFYERE